MDMEGVFTFMDYISDCFTLYHSIEGKSLVYFLSQSCTKDVIDCKNENVFGLLCLYVNCCRDGRHGCVQLYWQ